MRKLFLAAALAAASAGVAYATGPWEFVQAQGVSPSWRTAPRAAGAGVEMAVSDAPVVIHQAGATLTVMPGQVTVVLDGVSRTFVFRYDAAPPEGPPPPPPPNHVTPPEPVTPPVVTPPAGVPPASIPPAGVPPATPVVQGTPAPPGATHEPGEVPTPHPTPSVAPEPARTPAKAVPSGVPAFAELVVPDPPTPEQASWRTDPGVRDAAAAAGVRFSTHLGDQGVVREKGYEPYVRSAGGPPCLLVIDPNGRVISATRPATAADVKSVLAGLHAVGK